MQSVAAEWQSRAYYVSGGGDDGADSGSFIKQGGRLVGFWPHTMFAYRSSLGVLIAGVLVSVDPISSFLGGRGAFFAIIVPPLAAHRNFGGTIQGLLKAFPFIIASVVLATFVKSGLPANTGVDLLLVFLSTFFIEFCGGFVGGLGKKLASGLFLTIILTEGTFDEAWALIGGIAIGYFGALVGALLPPKFAVVSIRQKLSKVCRDTACLFSLAVESGLPGRHDRRLSMPLRFSEENAFLFGRIWGSLRELESMISLAEAETIFKSFSNVSKWISFLDILRVSAKGFEMSQSRRLIHSMEQISLPDEYLAFKRTLHACERELVGKLKEFLHELAMLDGPTPKAELGECFINIKERVRIARLKLIAASVDFNHSSKLRDE